MLSFRIIISGGSSGGMRGRKGGEWGVNNGSTQEKIYRINKQQKTNYKVVFMHISCYKCNYVGILSL